MTPDRLRLRAADAHDLLIIGSCVQDSIVPVVSMFYDGEDKSFTLLLNRFMWEVSPDEGNGADDLHFYRTHSGLRFSHVSRVQYQGFSPKDIETTLNLLSVQSLKEGVIRLIFSDKAVIQLYIDSIETHLFDVEDAWLSPVVPQHAIKHDESHVVIRRPSPRT